ncbi:MAG TPA: chorismate mutase [Propylenella sp.]
MDRAAPDPLQAIRGRIDAIDEKMHRLLIERSGVIAELIETKGTSKPGDAFRPDREADMMRRMVMRHEGRLPLVTVEHIWREIITTFTAMQAPFGIAAGPADDNLAMRDLIRFYFGFSIPVSNCSTAEEAIERVARSGKDVALVAQGAAGRWWTGLAGPAAPKIFAKLPYIEVPARPAHLPAYVIGPPLKEVPVPDVRVLALYKAPGSEAAVAAYGGRVAADAGGELLVELPVAAALDDIFGAAGAGISDLRELGGFSQPIEFKAERVA